MSAVTGRLCVLVMAAILLTACSRTAGEGGTKDDAAAVVRAALSWTLAVDRLRVERSELRPNGVDREVLHFDYQSPDRVRMFAPIDGSETFFVGTGVYLSDPARAGIFTVSPVKSADVSDMALRPLIFLERRMLKGALPVDSGNGIYRVEIDDGTAELRIGDGYVTWVHLHLAGSPALDEIDELSDFDGDVPPIEAPPTERVVPAGGPQPRCDIHGDSRPGFGGCFSPGETSAVPLPAPVGSTESTLQIRPILSADAGRCGMVEVNPEPERASHLASPKGTCYELGPSETELEAAAQVVPVARAGGGIDIHVALTDADRVRCQAVLSEHLDDNLALVMFGRVVVAGSIDEKVAKCTILVLPDLTPELASRVVAALGGSVPTPNPIQTMHERP